MGDEPGRVDLALYGQPEERAVQANLIPAPGDVRRDPADLGADQPYAVVVELVAEPQPDALALVEARGGHPAVDRDRAARLVQRRLLAARLDRHVGARAVGELAHLRPHRAVADGD